MVDFGHPVRIDRSRHSVAAVARRFTAEVDDHGLPRVRFVFAG